MHITKAVEGFLLEITAGPYSPETVRLYRHILTHLGTEVNKEIELISLDDIKTFMAAKKQYSGSYQDNHWKCLRTFYRWCNTVLGINNLALDLPRPRFKVAEIIPFTEHEVKKLLEFSEYTPEFERSNAKPYRIRRPTRLRDRAVILTLLDTGMRIGELCRLEIRDVNLQTGEISIAPYSTGRKTRPRTVFIGSAARRSVWLYLAKRPNYRDDDSLILSHPDAIRKVLKQIGLNAGIHGVHPHRFRHTFAIQYLRNGGDVFTLQRLLGHETLDMVRRYLHLADTDSAAAHRRASPADRWKL